MTKTKISATRKAVEIPEKVEAVFQAYAPAARAKLLRLRKLVLQTAAKMDTVALEETLKWEQPSYLAKGG